MQFVSSRLGLDDHHISLKPAAWLALMLISLAAMLPGFFNIPTMDRDEARYSQASRQMMETGDYVDIRFQEQARHVKPVGIYWMQVVTTAPFGGSEAPQWAHRLPSLFGCLIAVALTAWFGARLGGSRAGFTAGLIMAVGLLMSVEARTAKTDAMLLASITMAQVALYYIFHPPDSKEQKFVGWPLVFWLAQGAGLIIKGPIITLVSVTTLLALCLWRRDISILKRLNLPVGLLVMFAVVLPWVVIITIQTQGGFIEESIGHALMGKVATGDDSHGGPPGYHTVGLLAMFWPATLLLVLAAVTAWQRRREPLVQYLIAWIVPTWVVFELVATKLPHYVLPVYPAIAILAAFGVSDAAKLLSLRGVRIAHWIVTVLFVIATGLLAWLPYYLGPEIGAQNVPGAAILVVLAALFVIGAGLFLAMKPTHDRVLPLAVSAVVYFLAMYQFTFPAFDKFWLTRGLDREVASLEGCDNIAFATLGYREPSVVFTFGTQTLLASDERAVTHLQQNPSCGLLAVSQVEEARFQQMLAERDLDVLSLGSVEGYNYVKGDELVMTLYAGAQTALTKVPGERDSQVN
ncbi:glycosyltransferase family 39 protein [Parvularcula sp. IMCC14364]|uniref:ArnT family glycosyltransferase n=1 Tax=Parvularcula sp. IMCC14364 TaxID=3067902 RepID=UPI0027408307|nr:glycosyltransferase family 39 protein [Parvularcula sp. IMCC14364]